MTGSKIIADSPSKMPPNFEAVVSVLLQLCGQICPGMPYPCIFVEEVVPLLEKQLINCFNFCLWSELENKQ